jgi:hypothetical protein
MLPVIDYGSIAIVIPKITAIGLTQDDNNKYCLEIFLSGADSPILIAFDSEEEAEEEKKELIAIVAQYYYIEQFGPDFDIKDMLKNLRDSNDDDDDNNDDGNKQEH